MTDISALLYRIKMNIKAIEAGETQKILLDEVVSDYLELLELIKLFLISERDSYYGYFLMNMRFKANLAGNCIAGIKLNEFPPVFEANPLLHCKFTLKEIIYIVCHEIDHVVLNHPAEMLKANPEQNSDTYYRFNLAADAAVNDRLNYEIKVEKHSFMSPPDGLIISNSLSKMFQLGSIRAMEHYAYYFDLIRNKDKDTSTQQNGQSSMMSAQKEKDGQTGNAVLQESISNEGQRVITAQNIGDKLVDHDWKGDGSEDAESIAAATKELVNSAVAMMNDETRGMMPGHFMEQVGIINEPPKISWQSVLKKYVGTISASKRKTKMRLNRRQPERFDLSGKVDDKILKIIVAIDTSGSVSNQMIGQIFNEIFGILAKRHHEITVIECDSKVRRVYRAQTPADIKKKVLGRGGTLFAPVIDYINNDKYFRDALMIYFTDGFGESEIPKPKTYRNMWVILGGYQGISLKEPYGVVLNLK